MTSLLLGLLLATAGGAAGASGDRYEVGRIEPKIVCRSDPRYSFALYLPSAFTADKDRTWPLLLLFDARGRGALAAERFREGAERFGWVIVSSNDTKSDDASAPNAEAIQAVWKDAQTRFPIDPRRIVTSGFSGGARLAFAVAASRGSSSGGVVAASGGLPTGLPAEADPGFPVFGTAGVRDFNYREMRALDRSLAKLGSVHRLEIFDGGHEWLPASVATRAIGWLEVQAMRRGTRPRDPTLAGTLLVESVSRAKTLEEAGDIEAAWEEASDAVKSFDGLVPPAAPALEDARRTAARLETAALREARESQRRDAQETATIRRLREELERILAEPEPQPFATVASRLEIARWRERAASGAIPDRLSAARVVEDLFTQSVFYRPQALLAKNEPARAALSLEIAAAWKPDSAVAWYDLACARARAGDSHRALGALRTAVEKGFRDGKQIATDPDLASLRGAPEFQALVKSLEVAP